MHRLVVPGDTDVGHKTLERPALQCRYRLWLGRGDCGLESPLASLVQDSARASQLLNVVMMHGQLVYWSSLFRTLREGPSFESFGTRVEDFFDIGTIQVRREGDVEGEIDHGISRGKR